MTGHRTWSTIGTRLITTKVIKPPIPKGHRGFLRLGDGRAFVASPSSHSSVSRPKASIAIAGEK